MVAIGNNLGVKEIEMIHRLFLVIAMYCQASFNQSLNVVSWLEKKSTVYML